MRRGRLIKLTLVALALPTVALANSIDPPPFSISTGTFRNGSAGRNQFTGVIPQPTFNARVTGHSGDIQVGTTVLSMGCNVTGNGSCTFASGTLTVRAPVSFTSSLDNGMIVKTGDSAVITADIVPSSMFPEGGSVRMSITYNPAGPPFSGTLMTGSARVNIIPEPSTLLSLGTGLVGLAGMMRRKLKLAT